MNAEVKWEKTQYQQRDESSRIYGCNTYVRPKFFVHLIQSTHPKLFVLPDFIGMLHKFIELWTFVDVEGIFIIVAAAAAVLVCERNSCKTSDCMKRVHGGRLCLG